MLDFNLTRGNSERLSFTGSAIGNGGIDADYSPTAVCFYINTIDPDAASEAFEQFKQDADTSLTAEQVKRKFIINESERHFLSRTQRENRISFHSLLKVLE